MDNAIIYLAHPPPFLGRENHIKKKEILKITTDEKEIWNGMHFL